MSKHAVWLRQEIGDWLKEGLIDQTSATAIAARYPVSNERSWGLFILTGIGSLIFGLGVILFFAYNWAALPRAAKLALIFAGLLLSHGTAWWLRRKPTDHANLVEGLHLLGTMMFGAGIWLIAQIYHMDEHYPTALLLWGIGALMLGWTVPSVIQGLLATLLISIWGLSETMDFNRVHLASIGIIALTLLPLAWVQRSRTLLSLTILALFGLLLLTIGYHWTYAIVFKLLFCSALMILAISHWSRRSSFPGSASVLRAMGALVYGACLLYMTFVSEFSLYQLSLSDLPSGSEEWYRLTIWGMLISTALVWLALMILARPGQHATAADRTIELQRIAVLFSLLVLMAYQLDITARGHTSLNLLSNAILALHCVLLIIRGTDTLQWRQVTLGCLTLCVLIMAHFDDLFQSLLMRSAAFLVIGALLFLVGHRYAQRKAREQSNA
ncbi:DUF2157 domain-containing protein [Granulosicoccus sp. 3-233]|uniref:DUF2157 domain-containing protein n=1 Tax=Granulosicoccus sp. 3-233 TaxID=3417969 RepID=UPI003D355015